MNNMESPQQKSKETTKHYLYHKVPEDMQGDTLYPLNVLKDKHPELYESMAQKYSGREDIMQKAVLSLKPATWTDVIHMSAVHPSELKKALIAAGMKAEELENMEYYQIDPDLLEKEQTTVYLHTPKSEEFRDFDPIKIEEHSSIPEHTMKYYKEKVDEGERPLFFLGVPHILHRGHIKISDLPVIKV